MLTVTARGEEQTSASAERFAVVVFNPVNVAEEKLGSVVRAAARAGWAEPRFVETTEDDPGRGMTEQAVADGASLVIAAGGDGTVRAVTEGLRGTDVPLGLLPLGTGNLLARNLKLPLVSLDNAAKVCFEGESRHIDIGVFRYTAEPAGDPVEKVFLVMAGIGLDAEMFTATRPGLKRRLGWLAYVDGGVRAARKSRRHPFRYQLDGGTEKSVTAHSIIVGNCGLLPGNLLLLPEAEVDDGELDIVALRPDGFLGWAKLTWKVIWDNGVLRRSHAGRKFMGPDKDVRTLLSLRGRRLVLRTDTPVAFEIDGDPEGEAVEIVARVESGALAVRVPAK